MHTERTNRDPIEKRAIPAGLTYASPRKRPASSVRERT